MGTNSAGNVGAPNEGKTDTNRGGSIKFPYTKAGRNTGTVAGPKTVPNSNKVDDNKRTTSDPRHG